MKRHIVLLISVLVLLVSCNDDDVIEDPCAHLNLDKCYERNYHAIDFALVNNYHQAIKISFTGSKYNRTPARIGKGCDTCNAYRFDSDWTVHVSDTSLLKTECADASLRLLSPDSVVNFYASSLNGTFIINPDGTCSCN